VRCGSASASNFTTATVIRAARSFIAEPLNLREGDQSLHRNGSQNDPVAPVAGRSVTIPTSTK
jgi:hypothetical protein